MKVPQKPGATVRDDPITRAIPFFVAGGTYADG